jgi:hypothetical protein
MLGRTMKTKIQTRDVRRLTLAFVLTSLIAAVVLAGGSVGAAGPARAPVAPYETRTDFDGDGLADLAVVRQQSGALVWYVRRSSDGSLSSETWGLSASDVPVSADFDGDFKADHTVFRVGSPSSWFARRSSNGALLGTLWGAGIDIPTVIGDYDGDNKADFATYRIGPMPGSASEWWVMRSSNNVVFFQTFGLFGDVPSPGDYDGDGRTDFSVRRSSTFYFQQSTFGFAALDYGLPSDRIAPGDYDGDNFDDLAVVRNTGGQLIWYVRNSSNGFVSGTAFGASGDFLTPGDYDGDLHTDIAVWRPSNGTFYILRSTNGTLIGIPWGLNGDYPVATASVH